MSMSYIFSKSFDFEGGKPSSVSVMNHHFLIHQSDFFETSQLEKERKPLKNHTNASSLRSPQRKLAFGFSQKTIPKYQVQSVFIYFKRLWNEKSFLVIPWALQQYSAHSFNHKTFVVFKKLEMAEKMQTMCHEFNLAKACSGKGLNCVDNNLLSSDLLSWPRPSTVPYQGLWLGCTLVFVNRATMCAYARGVCSSIGALANSDRKKIKPSQQ